MQQGKMVSFHEQLVKTYAQDCVNAFSYFISCCTHIYLQSYLPYRIFLYSLYVLSKYYKWNLSQVPTTALIPLQIAGRLSMMNCEILRQESAREQNFLKIHLAL